MATLTDCQIAERLAYCDPQYWEALERSLCNLGRKLNRTNLDPRTLTAVTLRENAEVRQHLATRDDRRTVGAGESYPEGFKVQILDDPAIPRDIDGGLRSRTMRAAKTSIASSAGKRNVEVVTPAGKRAYDKATALRTHLPSILEEAAQCSPDTIGDHILKLRDIGHRLISGGLVEEAANVSRTIDNMRSRQCAIAGKTRNYGPKGKSHKGSMSPGFTGAGPDHITVRDRMANTQLSAQPAKAARSKKSARKRTIV